MTHLILHTLRNCIDLIERMSLLLCIEMQVHAGFNSALAFKQHKALVRHNVNNNKVRYDGRGPVPYSSDS